MKTSIRSLIAAVLVVVFAAPALAGPPLICHPFQTEGGRLLAWGTGPGWNTPDRSYGIDRLVADTASLLTAEAPVLARMENIRRATIYAMRDPQVAHRLLRATIDRALATSTDSAAWFDAGYLIESYKQAIPIRETRTPELRAWAVIDETIKVDGYGWVKKAMAMAPANAEMEFAASLMTRGAVASAHRARALAAAAKGSILAKNLATSADFF